MLCVQLIAVCRDAATSGRSDGAEAEDIRRKVQAFEQEAERRKQEAEREVDDMLADLKKQLKQR